jgi:hypothetical protein
VRWRVPSGFSGRGVNSQVGLIVLALLAGLLVPLGAVAYLAGRDGLPRSCRSGVSTATQTEGAITWSSGPVLWFADGDLRRARRLVDYTPPPVPRASPSPSASGSPALAETASPSIGVSPGGSPSPGASPSPLAFSPAVQAAAISGDRRLVAFLVSDPPGAPGTVSLRMISPLDPPGTAAVEAWTGPWLRRGRAEVTLLPDGHILFFAPAHFESSDPSTRLVGVAENGSQPRLLEWTSEADFIKSTHSAWAETKSYQLPPTQPKLEGRVIGPNLTAAGILRRELRTPLLRRTLDQVAVGRAGHADTRVVCASGEPLTPAALSPDGLSLAVVVAGKTELLDLGGGRSLAPFLSGRVLDWRA